MRASVEDDSISEVRAKKRDDIRSAVRAIGLMTAFEECESGHGMTSRIACEPSRMLTSWNKCDDKAGRHCRIEGIIPVTAKEAMKGTPPPPARRKHDNFVRKK